MSNAIMGLHGNQYNTLALEQFDKQILMVTLDRPNSANAFNTEMAVELYSLFESLSMQGYSYRCVVLTGSGDRAFCAGGDLKERNGMSDAEWVRQHVIYERMARALLNCPVPLLAAVNGAAFGGGCEDGCCL